VLATTDPALLRLCLDPDSVWRGGKRSADALLGTARRHLDRIDAVHLRQSQGGIWDETVGPGDLPLEALADMLAPRAPLLVIEHAYEAGTPEDLDAVEAHRRSLSFVRAAFATRPQ
jgi:inosose dehydratase